MTCLSFLKILRKFHGWEVKTLEEAQTSPVFYDTARPGWVRIFYWHALFVLFFCRCKKSSRVRRWRWSTTETWQSRTLPCSLDWSIRKSSSLSVTAAFRRTSSPINFASLLWVKQKHSYHEKEKHVIDWFILKEKFVFLHIKPNHMIYSDHKWWIVILWRMVQFWERVTASWKSRRCRGTESALTISRKTINARFKRWETHRMFSGVFQFIDTKTWS